MIYAKTALSLEQQADQLIARGLLADRIGRVSPTTQWKERLFQLFDEYPEIPITEMGLPPNWRTHSLWKSPA